MYRFKFYSLMKFSIILIFFGGCKQHKGDITNPLYHEVMAIHDEVMPKMSTIHHYKKELKKVRTSYPEWQDSITTLIKVLDDADESMMVWMEEFKMPEKNTNEKLYLEAEKTKIQKVSNDMYSAMDLAKNFLDNIKKEDSK